jgi:hypothetical protein
MADFSKRTIFFVTDQTPHPTFFSSILFLSTTPLTGMTDTPLHMKCPMTLQAYGRFLKENNFFFITDQTPRPTLPDLFSSQMILCKKELTKTASLAMETRDAGMPNISKSVSSSFKNIIPAVRVLNIFGG